MAYERWDRFVVSRPTGKAACQEPRRRQQSGRVHDHVRKVIGFIDTYAKTVDAPIRTHARHCNFDPITIGTKSSPMTGPRQPTVST